MNETLLVSTTFERQDDAEELAKILLKKQLIACAQIQGPMVSLYWWKEEIAEAVEFVLTMKTFGSLFPEIEKVIEEEHPYDVPEIIAEPLVRISQSYLEWMKKELGQ